MATSAEQNLRVAPPGKLRVVHTDARDHHSSHLGDYEGINEARVPLRNISGLALDEVKVFDDQGRAVQIEL